MRRQRHRGGHCGEQLHLLLTLAAAADTTAALAAATEPLAAAALAAPRFASLGSAAAGVAARRSSAAACTRPGWRLPTTTALAATAALAAAALATARVTDLACLGDPSFHEHRGRDAEQSRRRGGDASARQPVHPNRPGWRQYTYSRGDCGALSEALGQHGH